MARRETAEFFILPLPREQCCTFSLTEPAPRAGAPHCEPVLLRNRISHRQTMAIVLPSTVQELNSMQSTIQFSSPNMYVKDSNKEFENIATEKRIKREVSLPTGVENWNIGNYESYLNFEDNLIPSPFEAVQSEDRLVPEEGYQRGRCESFSSVSSAVEDKPLVYHNLGVKSFKTVAMDSGSTCFSSDHSYINSNASNMKFLDVEETYENLDVFFQQVPELNVTDSMSSSLSSSIPSPAEEPKFEFAVLQDNFGLPSTSGQTSLDNLLKRSADIASSEDELNPSKRQRGDEPVETYYFEHRRKNNIASKNCRKTRKEKQKEMESRITDLEKERESLKVEVRILEEMIQAHKQKIFQILRPR